MLYGLPPAASYLATLSSVTKWIPNLRLLVDHPSQIKILESQPKLSGGPWSVFIKIDMATRRAGVPLASPRLKELIQVVEASPAVELCGFYAHAGHSYGSHSSFDAIGFLHDEIEAVSHAAK